MGCQGRVVGVVVPGLCCTILDGGMVEDLEVSWAVLKMGVKCIDLGQHDLTHLPFPTDGTLLEGSHLWSQKITVPPPSGLSLTSASWLSLRFAKIADARMPPFLSWKSVFPGATATG